MSLFSSFQGTTLIMVQVTILTLVGAIPLLLLIPRLPEVGQKFSTYIVFAGLIIIPSYLWLIANQWKGDALLYERIYALQIIVIGLGLIVRGLRLRYSSIIPSLGLIVVSALFIWHIINTNNMDITLVTDRPELDRPAQLMLAGWETTLLTLIMCCPRRDREGDNKATSF